MKVRKIVTIAKGATLDVFNREINEHLKDGYELHGEMFKSNIHFCQMMTREVFFYDTDTEAKDVVLSAGAKIESGNVISGEPIHYANLAKFLDAVDYLCKAWEHARKKEI